MSALKDNFITPRNQDFAQWYKDVCYYANLFNYGPVKGTIIFRPYAWAIWEGIVKYLNKRFDELNVSNVYLPMMIPKSLFAKEQEHIAGFNPELLTVTKYGDRSLPEELYIRPSSEIVMAQEFAQIIKSYRDLPIKYNQWCNVMRWEKNTKPFLRTSEFVWQEGHTAHKQSAEAKDFAQTILKIYIDLSAKILAIPVIAGEKTHHERFAGAVNSYTIESIMHDGQALQCGTSHYFGNKFSKIFNIKYEDPNQQLKYPATTSWGISTRLLGAIIMTHGDDRGLKIPFPIAPVQIQIITPPKINQALKDYVYDIVTELQPHYRVQFMQSKKSFGFQINEAEVRGVPLRLEIGSRDCQANQITIARRDTVDKTLVAREALLPILSKLAATYQANLYKMANANLQSKIIKINSYQNYCDKIKQANIMVLMPFCTKINCERIIKNETQTTSRCMPFAYNNKSLVNEKCWRCDEPAVAWTYFAKAY